MKKSIVRSGMAAVAAVAMAFGLAACGGGAEAPADGNGEAGTSEGAPAADGESEEFTAALNEAVTIINDQIAANGSPMQQIMLASDVDQPTQKYGMWVMPFKPDTAVVEKFMSTIQIADGTDFQVELTSAATGKAWTMDQDGTMAEKTE